MKQTMTIEDLGMVTYEESSLSGKVTLSVDSVPATQVNKKTFAIDGKTILLKGSYVFGLTLQYGDKEYVFTEKPRWYEYLLAFLPLFFALFWGNSAALCSIVPIVGGAVGGAIGGAASILSLCVSKQAKTTGAKIGIGLAFMVGTFLSLFLLAILIGALL